MTEWRKYWKWAELLLCCCPGKQTCRLTVPSSLLFHHSHTSRLLPRAITSSTVPTCLLASALGTGRWAAAGSVLESLRLSTTSTCRPAVACRHRLVVMKLRMHRHVPDKLEDVACRRGSGTYTDSSSDLYLTRQAHSRWLEMLVAWNLQGLDKTRLQLRHTWSLFFCSDGDATPSRKPSHTDSR